MKIIGVTGGVGAGKSALLTRVMDICNCKVIFSDNVANDVKKKGMPAYDALVDLLGDGILEVNADGSYGEIDKKKMAAAIFKDDTLLQKVNDILHPATNKYIADIIDQERALGEIDYLFIEASAQSGKNIDKVFNILAKSILDDIHFTSASRKLSESSTIKEKDIRTVVQTKRKCCK